MALHEAGGLGTDDPAYRRGLAFLLGSQKADGTWFVASRSKPFQPYFESGFPYGKNQFIAVAASAAGPPPRWHSHCRWGPRVNTVK